MENLFIAVPRIDVGSMFSGNKDERNTEEKSPRKSPKSPRRSPKSPRRSPREAIEAQIRKIIVIEDADVDAPPNGRKTPNRSPKSPRRSPRTVRKSPKSTRRSPKSPRKSPREHVQTFLGVAS